MSSQDLPDHEIQNIIGPVANWSVMKYLGLLLLVLSLALVCYPRFDRQDLGPIKNLVGKEIGKPSLGDSPLYVRYVDYFRGKAEITEIDLPFRYRPLAPLIASVLPIENPMTALNVVNLCCLYIALFFLFRFLKYLRFSFRYALGGCFMFSVSFQTFYYSTIGGVDPVFICFLVLGSYFIFTERWWHLTLVLLLGALAKEVIVLLIPLALVFLWKNERPYKAKLAIFLLAYLLPILLLRYLFRETGYYNWFPSIEMLAKNIRPRALLSVVLTFGLPGFLSLGFAWYYKELRKLTDERLIIPLLSGIFFTILLTLYSAVTAHTDGRFVWPMVVYSIPLSLWFVREWPGMRVRHH